MRFSTLVALAIAVSSTPSLAAPALFAPHRANSTHPAHPGHAANGTAANSTHPAHHGHAANGTAANSTHPAHHNPHHAHHGHSANATAANSTQASKRAVTSDIIQAIEAAFDSLPVARKRDVVTTALQELESLGLSRSGSTVDKRFKLPEISPSTESALNNAANVATIGGGIAKIWDSLDGSSSSSKRDDGISKVWGALADVGDNYNLNNINWEREFVEADERALKIPASVTTWLKSLGNVASIGAGGAAVVGAVDGGSTLKRELDQASNGVDLATLLDGVTPQFEDRSVSSSEVSGLESFLGKAATASSVGGTLATVWSALDGSSGSTSTTSTKRELAIDIPDSLSSHGLPRLVVPTESSWAPGPIAISKKRSDSTDAESTLQQITAALEAAIGRSGNTRRSIGITPEQLQQIAAQLNTGTADLD